MFCIMERLYCKGGGIMPDKVRNTSSVQSVDRALTIVDLLKNEPNGLGVTELADLLDVAKSTIHRLLTSLLNKGYVRKDNKTAKYKLGLNLIELGNIVTQSLDLRNVASEYLKKLVDETGETAHLVILENGEIVYIDKVESTQTIRMYSQVGRRAPVHCTGAGKVILAFSSEHEVDQILEEKGLRKFTENTITSKKEFKENLIEIKNKGYSIDDEEHELGIRCIGAPIFDHRGKITAGISITGPFMRMTYEKIEEYNDKVVYLANEISKRLGYKI